MRACKLTASGHELESKVGRMVLRFDCEEDRELIFKKAGATRVWIEEGGEKRQEIITGIVGILCKSDRVIITRENCIGGIELLGIEIEKETEMDWKAVIRKCRKHSGIRLVNGKLFASEGGWLKFDGTGSIETVPDGAGVVADGMIRFVSACEVVGLDISGTGHRKPEIVKSLAMGKTVMREPANHITFAPKVLLESSGGALSVHVKNEKIMDTAITLAHKNSINIPISAIQPEKTYTITLEAQNINGNGKVYIGINNIDKHTVIVSPHKRNYCFNITSNENGGPYNLIIDRGAAGTGTILIHKIMMKESADLNYKFLTKNTTHPTIDTFDDALGINWLKPIRLNNVKIKPNTDRKFVIIIPSYKNSNYVERNIASAISQNYKYYRVIFTDDCSPDDTFERAKNIVEKAGAQIRTTLIKNKTRSGALANLYKMIHSCADDEIVLTLDGDDWLPDVDVLTKLNNVYKSGDVWLTYGQYQNWPGPGHGISKQIPDKIIDSNGFRSYDWCSSHLRTFYSWLFKLIKTEDLYYNGSFMEMTWDLAMMFPMLEMAGKHSKFISDILYVYNMDNPINDHKVNKRLQSTLDNIVRKMPKYNRINLPEYKEPDKNIGLMIIATNKYKQFINPLISSADRHFFNDEKYNVKYFIFTDDPVQISSMRNSQIIPIDHRPFPFASMDRFKHFTNAADYLAEMDYIYYVDVDCLFVDNVGDEAIGDLVGVRHCGYYRGGGTFEGNQKSVFYRPLDSYKHYYGGGFSGGKTDKYLELSKICSEKIEEDLNGGHMPVWHDETAINWYFADHEPLALDPGYHYPQGGIEKYKAGWLPDKFEPKILLLDKNHNEIRS